MPDMTEDIRKVLARVHAHVQRAAVRDPARAAVLAHQAVETWMAAQPELARLRRGQVRAARDAGANMADLATQMGIARQRIYQIADDVPVTRRGPRPNDRTKAEREAREKP